MNVIIIILDADMNRNMNVDLGSIRADPSQVVNTIGGVSSIDNNRVSPNLRSHCSVAPPL